MIKNGIEITFTGAGNETVPVSAEPNEGLDRSAVFVFKTIVGDVRKQVSVSQLGRREVFNASDGAFLPIDGTFNVLKL